MKADMKNKLKALSLKEILGYSIHSEDVASTYYWTLANVFEPNDLVKAKFLAISNDEKLHKQALLNLHKAEFGDENYVVPEGLPPFESVTDVKTVESFMEAIETAMHNELNAHDIYMFLARQNRGHRKLFKYLARTEMGHYETLKQDYHFFGDEFENEPGVSISQVYAANVFRPLDIEK